MGRHCSPGERARHCYAEVYRWDRRWRNDATTAVQGVAVQIRTQGLMVTLASLMSVGGHQRADQGIERRAAGRVLSDALALWLLEKAPHRPLRSPLPGTDDPSRRLLAACAEASCAEYAAAQREAMLFFDQLKIFADALEGKDD